MRLPDTHKAGGVARLQWVDVARGIGVMAPLALWMVARRYGVLRWLGLGTDVRRKTVTAA